MSAADIIVLIIVGIISLILLLMAVILLQGKGANLIAGYNTSKVKSKYDAAALCRFVGKILLPIAILSPLIIFGCIYKIIWLPIIYIVIVLLLVAFALVYLNTGNRFKK